MPRMMDCTRRFTLTKILQYETPENLCKTPITIVFIDLAVDEYQSLVDSAIPETEVIVLDSTRAGVVQITKAFQGRTNVAAGDAGEEFITQISRLIDNPVITKASAEVRDFIWFES